MPEKSFETFNKYAKTQFKTFDQLEFNEVDGAIFSWLSYLLIHEDYSNNFSPEGMPITDLLKAEYFEEMLEGIYWPEESLDLMIAVACNPRYRNGRIKYYRFENDMETSLQFSALVISFAEDMHHVVFRGTDKSVHGWKENFKLIMKKMAPGKMMAINYLNSVGRKLDGQLIIGGHSKGGHLAVLASAHCDEDIQSRITKIYSFDGPGFLERDLEFPGMKTIQDRIVKVIPTGSTVGILLKNEAEPKFINSNQIGALQHFPGSWEIKDNAFVQKEYKSGITANVIDNKIDKWIENASDEELELLMETLFEILEAAKVDNIQEILKHPKKYLPYLLKAYKDKTPEEKAYMKKTLSDAFAGRTKEDAENGTEYKNEWDDLDLWLNSKDIDSFGKENNLFI